MHLKERFLAAIQAGELGYRNQEGDIMITLKAFKEYFRDIPLGYRGSFLPAATIEPGRNAMTPTKFVFRSKPGVYRLHPDIMQNYNAKISNHPVQINSHPLAKNK